MATIKEKLAGWTLTGQQEKKTAAPLKNMQGKSELLAVPLGSVPQKVNQIEGEDKKSYFELKNELHRKLISRIDLATIEAMSASILAGRISELTSELITEQSLPINEQERSCIIRDLQNEIMGLGPLEILFADSSITEIIVNGAEKVFVEKNGKLEFSDVRFNDNAHLLKIIDKIVSRVGRRIDEANPMVDARLPDGSRVNAIIPPLAIDGPALTIRRFGFAPLQMDDLIRKNALTNDMASLLAGIVKAKLNVVISGGTGSGKTTLLNILSSYISPDERVITIEDTAELRLQQPHVVRLETRVANIEGEGAISMRPLLKNSLRMRPDRIVLGEIRSDEVIDMLQAMNTGHDGSLTTVHANTPRDALSRIENLVGLGGVSIPIRPLRQQITSAIHVVVQANRLSDGSRKITSIHEIVGMEGDVISSQDIFVFERQGTTADGTVIGSFKPTGVRPTFSEKLLKHGIKLPDGIFDPNRVNRNEVDG